MKIIITIFTVLFLSTLADAQMIQLDTINFGKQFGIDLWTFAASTAELGRDYLFYFYTPENQQSFQALKFMKQIGEEYQRQSIGLLKRKGVNEYQQFQKQLKKNIQIVAVDCSPKATPEQPMREQQICKYFNIQNYPAIVYLTKNRKAYRYKGHLHQQQMISFLLRSTSKLDYRFLQQYSLNNSILTKIKFFLSNQILMYILVFLALPFAFGYFVMAKNKNPQQKQNKKQHNNQTKNRKTN